LFDQQGELKRRAKMKKVILLVVLFTSFVGILGAQPKVGVKIGLNMANVGSENDMEIIHTQFGAHLGAMLQYPVIPRFLVQTELLYTMKGYIYKSSDLVNNSAYKNNGGFDYLEIPILFKYNAIFPSIKFQPYMGTSIGLLLAAQAKLKTTYEGQSHCYNVDLKKDMKDFDLGLNLGIDTVIMEGLTIGLRYNIGLNKIYHDSMDLKNDDKANKNRTLMLSFGHLMDLD